jgi:hypothetical protein
VVNTHGFRERERQAKSLGEWRIGLLGDSMTAGIGVKQRERFGEVLYEAIQQQAPSITLWNLGAPRCGTACEEEILDGVGRAYDLDEIILAFFGGNDVEDNVHWDHRVATQDTPVPGSMLSEEIRGWLREHCRLTTFLWINIFRAFASLHPQRDYSVSALQSSWPATERALARMKEVVGSRPFTILYLPATPEWDNRIWKEMKRRYGVTDDGRFVAKQAVMQWAQQHGVAFVDATLWLRTCPSVKDCTFPVDGHWNSRGHHLVGEGLAQYWKSRRDGR